MSLADLNGRSYRGRAIHLRKLGFQCYADYLKSELWRQVREKVFRLKGRFCHLCGNYATQAHHTRYHSADLTGRKTKHIHPICGKCHKEIEYLADGRKATVGQAKMRFKKRRKERREIEHLTSLFL